MTFKSNKNKQLKKYEKSAKIQYPKKIAYNDKELPGELLTMQEIEEMEKWNPNIQTR